MAPSCHAAVVVERPDAYSRDGVSKSTPAAIVWRGLEPSLHDRSASAWCDGVGPAVVAEGAPAPPANALLVVSWNMHVGGGDLPALLSSLGAHDRSDGARPAFVLLLQEVFRSSDAVPPLRLGARTARRIAEKPPAGERRDIVQLALDLGLWAAYVPSMRNGGDGIEDRGNAIVSNLPLDAIEAIELPAGRQRRVAVAADVAGRTTDGRPWRIRVASIHLESRASARRLWVFGAGVRAAQAQAAVRALEHADAAILGGDFNSWSGFDEASYRETAPLFPDTHLTDGRPTFAFRRRLDHLFFRLPDGWRARFTRLDDRFGSDHHPLAGVVQMRATRPTD